MKKYLLAMVCVFSLLAGCQESKIEHKNADSLAFIKENKKIKVGYIVFPPCVTKNLTDGKLDGHFILTMEEIKKETGWEIEYIETDWNGFAAGLQSNKFDLCIAPTFVTIKRALSVDFTDPLFYAGNSAIVSKGEKRFSDIMSLDQKGVKVAVTNGEAGYEFAKTNFKNAEIIVTQGSDQSLTFQNVVSGRADVALGDAYATAQFAKANSTSVKDLYADNPYNLTPVSWSIKSGNKELLDFINNALKTLNAQGKLLDYEKQTGANWLHIQQKYAFN